MCVAGASDGSSDTSGCGAQFVLFYYCIFTIFFTGISLTLWLFCKVIDVKMKNVNEKYKPGWMTIDTLTLY